MSYHHLNYIICETEKTKVYLKSSCTHIFLAENIYEKSCKEILFTSVFMNNVKIILCILRDFTHKLN